MQTRSQAAAQRAQQAVAQRTQQSAQLLDAADGTRQERRFSLAVFGKVVTDKTDDKDTRIVCILAILAVLLIGAYCMSRGLDFARDIILGGAK